MMPEQADLLSLINKHTRRLQKLEETRAIKGIDTPPEVLVEIEDITATLQALQAELATYRSPHQTQHPQAPLVHIHCWGKRPARFPDQATVGLDWQAPGKFEERADGTRRLPAAKTWQEGLLPALNSLPGQTCPHGWLRLAGHCSLSVGFALGQVFRAKERYQIEVAQFVPERGVTEYWASNAQPPKKVAAPAFAAHVAPNRGPARGDSKNDGVVVVAALKSKAATEILANVGMYFGEREAFGQIVKGPTALQSVKGVLLLEAEAATQGNRSLEGWETAALAKSSTQVVNTFKHELNLEKLHLFMAAPLSLAVFMGHYWHNVRKPVQCYEEVGTNRFYEPACLLTVK